MLAAEKLTLQAPVHERTHRSGDRQLDALMTGRPIRVCLLWTLSKPGCPRCEQAFSPDGGKPWETQWVMDFMRMDAP